ncbi:MAG: FAD-dependent oxidoreductase [Lentisphaeria bacterium]|nr:FAD-dependent oxidoreductase [Lentisphaeria bacterium]
MGDSYDVVVVGGGTAGVVAALQSARAGARTALLELAGQLGGTMTAGGVNFPGIFHAWGRQIIAGIGWTLVERAVAMNSDVLPDFSVYPGSAGWTWPLGQHWRHQVMINAPLYAALAEEACVDAGVALRYYEVPTAVKRLDDGLWELRSCAAGEERVARCRQLVDCTGDASLCGLLGLERLREDSTQPGTLWYRLENFDLAGQDHAQLQARLNAAVASGQLLPTDLGTPGIAFRQLLGLCGNHIMGADSSTAAGRTLANIAGRQCMLRVLRFVRSMPGCENARIKAMQWQTAVRETWRVKGEVVIGVDDYVRGMFWPDAVCHAYYPVDLHDSHGVKPEQLRPGVVPTVPFRALIPAGSSDILVAGRCLSSDRLANSALRVQAPCMATGQAAGAAAALAARRGCTPSQVPFAELTALLREHGAIVPEPPTAAGA